jgi:hypothetical protein
VQAARGDEVTFIGMAGLDDVGASRAFIERYGLEAFPHAHDADGSLWARFGTIGRSAFVFLSRDGDMEPTGFGEYGDADKLSAKIDELLGA